MPRDREAALADLIAVDGSPLKALARMAWALWQDATHRAVKMHVAFSVFEKLPVKVTVTHGNSSERDELRKRVQRGGFYVANPGYADYSMFREFDDAGVQFLNRRQENSVFEIEQELHLSEADRAAGVISDVLSRRLGTEKHNSLLKQPLRIVEIQECEPGQIRVFATNALDPPAERIMIACRYRWQIELFFHWLKCVLGCNHLLSQNPLGGDTADLLCDHRGDAYVALDWRKTKQAD